MKVKPTKKKPATKRAPKKPAPVSELVMTFRDKETGESFGAPIVIPETALNPAWTAAYRKLMETPLFTER